MLTPAERDAIAELWREKLSQDARGVPQRERHRNLEPVSAEFIRTLAAGCSARRLLEIGGSSGLSTLALAAAARATGGRLRNEGCAVVDKLDESEYGKFGWVIDPEGNKVELWEPPPGQ